MTDPRTYGVGAGDVVDVTIRARITRIGPLSVTVEMDGDPALAEFGRVASYIPAEALLTMTLTEAKETR